MIGHTPCYICEAPMVEVFIDPRDLTIKPCEECLEIIQETADEMDDEQMLGFGEWETPEFLKG